MQAMLAEQCRQHKDQSGAVSSLKGHPLSVRTRLLCLTGQDSAVVIHTTLLPALMFFREGVRVLPLSAATGDSAFAGASSADGGAWCVSSSADGGAWRGA